MERIKTYQKDTENSTKESVKDENTEDEARTCPECGGKIIKEQREFICQDCGLVVDEDTIDHGPEWRSFNDESTEQKRRVGSPVTQTKHDKGLATNIGYGGRDGYGKELSGRKKAQINRMRKWNRRFKTKDSKDRNLREALGEIQRMCVSLGLPDDVQERASVIYRKAMKEDLLPGRSIEAVSTAALYAAAKTMGYPRTIDDMARVSRVGRNEFTRAYRYINKSLRLPIEPLLPSDYVPQLTSKLEIEQETQRGAMNILDRIDDSPLKSGRSRVGLAASAIYTAAEENEEDITQKEMSETAEISEVTLRNRTEEIQKYLEMEEERR